MYNVGSGEPVPNLEVARRLCDLVGERLGRPREAVGGLITFVKDRPGHGRLYAMVSEKVRRELEWEPKVPFEAGLEQTVDWYLARLERVRRVVSGEHRRYFEAVYERGWRAAGPQRAQGAAANRAEGAGEGGRGR